MNEQIKQIAFESGFLSAGFSNGKPMVQYEKELTKFARIIIEDCMGIALLSDGNGEQIAQEIRNHFTRGDVK